MLLFFSELNHAKQVKEMEKETMVLVNEFEIAMQEHQEVIDFQAEINDGLRGVNQKLGQELNQAGMIIEMQRKVIQQLVLELQKAGIIPVPPPEPKRDPRLAI